MPGIYQFFGLPWTGGIHVDRWLKLHKTQYNAFEAAGRNTLPPDHAA